MGNIAREDALYHVSTIQTIHAVGSHYSFLGIQNPAGLRVNEISLPEADIKLCHEVSIADHLLFDLSNQLAQVLPFHFLTFTVEIKPYILDVWVIQLRN